VNATMLNPIWATSLTEADREHFQRFGISFDTAQTEEIRRVTDAEARQHGFTHTGDLSGLVFIYRDPRTDHKVTSRLRRDHPEIENGREKNKYIAPYGDRRHLFFPRHALPLLENKNVPVVLVEAEKSALAMLEWSKRTGWEILPVAMGGCWGWRGRDGKAELPDGHTADEVGPLPDLLMVATGREVYVLLDSNVTSNSDVRLAERCLLKELRKLEGTTARVLRLPIKDGVNGPDDFIAVAGDAAFQEIFEAKNIHSAELILSKSGSPAAVVENALILFRTASEWRGVLGFDEFAQTPVMLKSAPEFSLEGKASYPRAWTDRDDTQAQAWLQRQGVLINSAKTVGQAITVVSRENAFHPVRNYLSNLQWDRIPRLPKFLHTYFGAQYSPFSEAAGIRWMISAVARAFESGCQADHALLLEGPQGTRKSSGLRALFGDDWFTDCVSSLGSKDSRLELLGKWCIEISELNAMRRAEIEAVKAYLTQRHDYFRKPYGARAENVPRQNVFAATSNAATPFTDETGNRRFWPVRCGVVDVKAIERDRNQLWAEAVWRYRNGEPWWMESETLNTLAALEQEERYEHGPRDEMIMKWAEAPSQREKDTFRENLPWNNSTAGHVNVQDCLIHGLKIPLPQIKQADSKEVARCLRHAGWSLKQERNAENRGKRYWVSPDPIGVCSGKVLG